MEDFSKLSPRTVNSTRDPCCGLLDPDLFGKWRTFLPDKATLVRGYAFRNDSGTLDFRHDLPSIQLSSPNINTALTKYHCLKPYVGFTVDAPPSISTPALGRFGPILPIICIAANVWIERSETNEA